MKNTISRQNSTQTTLETFSPPPTTTDGHHESLLLTARPQHREEHFNQSKILKIHLKDLVEKKLPILSFVVSLR